MFSSQDSADEDFKAPLGSNEGSSSCESSESSGEDSSFDDEEPATKRVKTGRSTSSAKALTFSKSQAKKRAPATRGKSKALHKIVSEEDEEDDEDEED